MVVDDRSVVERQRPLGAGDVLHRHAAAVGGGRVVGQYIVVERQIDRALIADAAAAARRSIAGLRQAVLDGDAVDGDGAQHHVVAGDNIVGVDIEDARHVIAVDGDGAAAGILNGQAESALGGGGVGEDLQ